MFTNPVFTQSFVINLGMKYVTKFLLAASVLAGIGMAALPVSKPFTYTVNGITVVRRSELGPWTGPGHNFGVIGSTSDPGVSLPNSSPITVASNGYSVVRRSELGPLTETVDNSLQARVPGQDFGPTGGTSNLGISLPSTQPFIYTLPSGNNVVRRSELGPLTETVDNSLQGRGPGHDYGVLDVDSDQRLSCLAQAQLPSGWRRVC